MSTPIPAYHAVRTDRPLSIVVGPDGYRRVVEQEPDPVQLGVLTKIMRGPTITLTLNPGWYLADPVADGQDTERYWLDDVVTEEHVRTDDELAGSPDGWREVGYLTDETGNTGTAFIAPAGTPEPVIRRADDTPMGQKLDTAFAKLLSAAAEADREALRRGAWPVRVVAGIDPADLKEATLDSMRLWTVPAEATFGELEPEYVGRHRAPEPEDDEDDRLDCCPFHMYGYDPEDDRDD